MLFKYVFRVITFTSCIVGGLALPADTNVNRDRIAFDSSGTQIVGYHFYPSDQDGDVPLVVMAHGLGLLQTSRIQPFAEQFAANGYHAITFDYRYWGESFGEPRNILDVASQHDDYRAAIAAAKALPGVDPKRIVIWGTSLSGGHVLVVGSQTPNLAGVIAQVPHTNGLVTVSALPPESLPGLIAAGVEDAARAAFGQAPIYIPLANHTGQFGALTQAGAYEGFEFLQPRPPPPGNVFAARFVLELPIYSPDSILNINGIPTFIGIAAADNVTPPPPARALAERLNADHHEYAGGHFSVYAGGPQYENILADELAFLKQFVPI